MRRRVIGNMMGRSFGGSLTGLAYLQSLFTGGQVGGLYNLTDPTIMFQSDLTTPITEANNTVFKANDLSGNGNHLTILQDNGSPSDRPIFNYTQGAFSSPYRADWALACMDINGGTALTNALIVAVINVNSKGNRYRPVGFGGAFYDNGTGDTFTWSTNDFLQYDGGYLEITAADYTPSTDMLITAIKQGNLGAARYDGVEVLSLSAPSSGNSVACRDIIRIGHDDDTALNSTEFIYGAIFLEGTFSTSEIQAIEAAVAEMVGYTY